MITETVSKFIEKVSIKGLAEHLLLLLINPRLRKLSET